MNLKKFNLVSLDSNIFSYHFHNHPQFVKLTDIVFSLLNQGALKATTSIITLTELLSIKEAPIKTKILEEAFLSTPNLTVFEVNYEIASEAAIIRRKYGFRTPDAIQLATAIHSKAKAFISNDERLKKFKKLRVILVKEVK